MIVTDFLKNNYKSPYFWIVIFIILLLITAVLVSIVKSNTRGCLPNQKRYPECNNECGPICNSGLYDCEKCLPCLHIDDTPCGDQSCCPKGQCNSIDGVSCCEGIPCGTKDNPQCCSVNETCDNGMCLSKCGYADGKAVSCSSGKECIHVSGASDDMWNRFKDDFKNDTPIRNNTDLYACAKSSCTSTIDKTFPYSVQGGTHTFYPCTKLINIGNQTGDVGYCTSTDPNNAYNCWLHADKDNCTNDTKCTYKSIYNTSFDDMTYDSNNIFAINDPTQKYEGNWCGDGTNSIVQFSKNDGTNNCSYVDCWKKIGSDEGVVNVTWDAIKGLCTGFIKCKDTIVDKQYLNQCDYTKKPDVCSATDINFNCNTAPGEIWSNSTNPCATQGGNCKKSITNGLKWCIRKDGSQLCVQTENDCLKQNFDTYINNSKYCNKDDFNIPLSNNIEDNSVGYSCFTTGSGSSCSAQFQYNVYIENRTPFSYRFEYDDSAEGNACTGNPDSSYVIQPLSSFPSEKLDNCMSLSGCQFYLGYSFESYHLDTTFKIISIEFPDDGYDIRLKDTYYGKNLTANIAPRQSTTEFQKYVSCVQSCIQIDGAYPGEIRIILYMTNMYKNPTDYSFTCAPNS